MTSCRVLFPARRSEPDKIGYFGFGRRPFVLLPMVIAIIFLRRKSRSRKKTGNDFGAYEPARSTAADSHTTTRSCARHSSTIRL